MTRTRGFVNVRRGFTIIELMVAMLIIAVVLAIVLPALSGARNTAKRAATQADLSRVGQAASQFQIDQRRLPGYFRQRMMADVGNGENSASGNNQRGFSSMQNIMLDLAGGVVPSTGASFGAGGEILEVGPVAGTGNTAFVNLSLVGSNQSLNGATRAIYYSPDRKNFLPDQGIVTSVDAHRALPNLVDAFGTPVLAWAQDDETRETQPAPTFGGLNFTDPRSACRFYWATNAAFLRSTALGSALKNQVYAAGAAEYSMLGAGMTEIQLTNSLAGLLGNAAYPQVGDPGDPAFGGAAKPRIGRAPLVFHSAGANGIYLGATENGGKAAQATFGGVVRYMPNTEPLNNFDDVIVTGGN
jgi:prepilin-type N-terminal cleavage/methylation domain-containing protein